MPKFVNCHKCNRGGNGNDKDKCAAGWKHIDESHLGCYCGIPIVGPIKPQPKLTRSKARYQRFLDADWWSGSFIDFCYWDAKKTVEIRSE